MTLELTESDDRIRSPLCENGQHDECAASSFVGICGCECHDYLDELDRQLYGKAA
jgi:hypothetical protein